MSDEAKQVVDSVLINIFALVFDFYLALIKPIHLPHLLNDSCMGHWACAICDYTSSEERVAEHIYSDSLIKATRMVGNRSSPLTRLPAFPHSTLHPTTLI